ncbi:MGMT family protein [Candidatus Uhrbacteria bacterium]|nr:MGMT family protein [Candidatus Uhrbacteria bacterium]
MKSFRERVFAAVKTIEKGNVLSYKDVARKAGNPKAARAVGAILKTNYDSAIPCHRVIRSDGSLGGYNRGGIMRKKCLLAREGYVKLDKNNQA